MPEYNLYPQNIKCDGCVHAIKNAMDSFSELTNITLDKDTKKLHFESAAEIDLTAIENKLKSIGYPVK